MSEAIFVEELTKAYNGRTVVNHLNLSVKSGTVFGLLGANGAGKSTTIECMLGTKQASILILPIGTSYVSSSVLVHRVTP